MTREEKFELLSRYLDDTLREGDVQAVEELLRTDPEFARALADVSLQHSLLHRMGKTHEAAPAESDSRVGSGIHRASPRRRAMSRRISGGVFEVSPWLRVAIPLAACILIVIAAVAVMPGDPPPSAPPAVQVPPADDTPVVRAPIVREPDLPVPLTPRRAGPVQTQAPKGRPPVASPLPETAPTPLPKPPAPVRPAPPRKTAPAPTKTHVTLATLGDVSGSVWVTEGAGIEKGPVASNHDLAVGQGIRTAPNSRVVVAYRDGSSIEVRGGTEIREFSLVNGKRAFLAQGAVTAQVGRQPRENPMVITTPHADVEVLGTRFIVRLSPDATRVSVTEGTVRVTRRSDGRSVRVRAGYTTLAGEGLSMNPKPIRSQPGLLVLYRFNEGEGSVIRDVSRVGTPLDLTISDARTVEWRPGALSVAKGTLIRSSRPASKIAQACRASNGLTIEAWLRPAAARTPDAPEPGRIVTCSSDLFSRNFCLEQGGPRGTNVGDAYNVRLRTSSTGANGFPPLFATPAGTVRLRLSHVVYVRTATEAIFYVDGRELTRKASPGDFSTWDATHPLLLADEVGGARPWAGEYHSLAIYGRALTAEEVKPLTAAGPE